MTIQTKSLLAPSWTMTLPTADRNALPNILVRLAHRISKSWIQDPFWKASARIKFSCDITGSISFPYAEKRMRHRNSVHWMSVSLPQGADECQTPSSSEANRKPVVTVNRLLRYRKDKILVQSPSKFSILPSKSSLFKCFHWASSKTDM